jgi:hypothetical protein
MSPPRPVTRIVLLTAVLTMVACDSPGAGSVPVAQVGDWILAQERLADLLVLAQPLPLDSATVGALVDQWVSMAALAQRVSGGADLDGQEATDASLWLERREAVLEAERRARLGSSAQVSAGQARAEFQADTILLLAQVLRRTGTFNSDAERDLQRRTAQSIVDDLIAGGSWAAAVSQSEDADTRASSGLLGLVRVNELLPHLQDAAIRLEPGQISSVVESFQGYHILHRPRFEDVSDLYARLLSDRLLEAADGEANRWVADSLQVHVTQNGAAALRALASEKEGAVTGGPLASWEGGNLEVDAVAPYVQALPDDARDGLTYASNEAAVTFLEQLAVRQARFEGAIRAGIVADSERLDDLMEMHRTDVAAWRAALSDGASPFSLRAVDRYMERLVARQIPLESLPPLLRRWLLDPLSSRRDLDAQSAAAASARRLINAASRRTGS